MRKQINKIRIMLSTALASSLAFGACTSDVDMGGNSLSNLANPVSAQDAVTLSYLENNFTATGDNLGNHTATQDVVLGSNAILGSGVKGISIDSIGYVGIAKDIPSTSLDIVSENSSGIAVSGYNETNFPTITLNRAKGNEASPATLVNTDTISIVEGKGYDGSTFEGGSAIAFEVNGSVSTGVVPSRVVFSTTDMSGSTNRVTTITSDGYVNIPAFIPTSELNITELNTSSFTNDDSVVTLKDLRLFVKYSLENGLIGGSGGSGGSGTPDPLPTGMTIDTTGMSKFVASVDDDDYAPQDGTPEAVTVDIQGIIDNASNQISFTLPYTTTGASTVGYPAYTSTVSVAGTKAEDATGRDFTLTYPAGTTCNPGGSSCTGTITATLTVSDTFNVKKLDINDDLPAGLDLASFSISIDSSGSTASLEVKGIPGVPDRSFGDGSHDFLYLPVVAADGETWLNNNLGARYANVNHADFNPVQQATARDDFRAYGSLFQWGRKADGHELRTCTSGTACTSTNGSTTANANEPANALFIIEGSSPFDWRVTQDDTLWANESSANNVCPVGYRVPTEAELSNMVSAEGITSYTTAASSELALTASGYRHPSTATLSSLGSYGPYWSSSVSGAGARGFGVSSSSQSFYSNSRAYGFSVRCIQD
ncbi:MAG: Unknown protein [uncultured Campylobacterales bacterium]|uniref:Uncharacterized protein n=1 Tax=uncultured Campylobacterales bacterium TaxID=352960 RepID=A0A6S6SXP3_9BACT|nr:MAG: Unknown protein [uncultured Campylobacterales bacterium]